ncbi:50S ribosomal protein L29 [archaeon]|jgi:large subunit ribosomal protein L29|nr:50S ribosomal protein L29 [archaeon]MBT3450722.1 50S ribosomal protein L29 [archaeon]MBT6869214.1 50S ribosomal protein L29 [archaeon]MBT7193750.1 50S ribosomal protein L29 [archaeon]MBT7381397.1 50S ribosomal protein L29 [archaeon]
MKITKEFQNLSDQELKNRLEEFKKELFKFRSQLSTGNNPESSGKLRQTKKNIARIKTIFREREIKSLRS